MYYKQGIQLSRGMGEAIEYATGILSAQASGRLILRLALWGAKGHTKGIRALAAAREADRSS